MANPLEIGSVSPAAPNPEAGNPLQGGPVPQAQAAPAPPTHDQTVAALRHFDAIKGELKTLLGNSSLGKSDVKSQIIDGVARLVSQRIMKPEQAVIELSQVPKEPLQQRKWLQQQMTQAVQAERGILAHHAAGFAGQGPMPTPNADDHMDHMGSLTANYGKS